MKLYSYVTALLLSAVPLPALAQTGTYPPPPPPMRGTIPPPPPVGGVRAFPPPPQKTPEIPGWSAYNFTPSAEKTKKNYEAFVAKYKKDAFGIDFLKAIDEQLVGKDILAPYDAVFTKMGLRRDNAADVVTYFLISGYQIASKSPAKTNLQQINGTKTFVAEKLKSRPGFVHPATKQDLAEMLLLSIGRYYFTYDNRVANGKALVPTLTQSVAFDLVNLDSQAALGIDLKSLTLTADGIKMSSAR